MVTSTWNDIWVVIIEANLLAGKYLVSILSQDPSIRIVQVEALQTLPPNAQKNLIFLIDRCSLPIPLNECVRRLKLRIATSRFLVLDRGASPETIYRLVWFGINGFVEHDRVEEELVAAVRHVGQREDWIPRNVLAMHSHVLSMVQSEIASVLTRRESEILELVKRRLSNREISGILKIKESTVKFHLANILSKLNASSRREFFEQADNAPEWSSLLVTNKAFCS